LTAGIIAEKHADEVVLEPRLIAVRYLRTWFFLDLVSSLPLDYIILVFSPEASVTQLLHAGRWRRDAGSVMRRRRMSRAQQEESAII
jgi:hypothetical protein